MGDYREKTGAEPVDPVIPDRAKVGDHRLILKIRTSVATTSPTILLQFLGDRGE